MAAIALPHDVPDGAYDAPTDVAVQVADATGNVPDRLRGFLADGSHAPVVDVEYDSPLGGEREPSSPMSLGKRGRPWMVTMTGHEPRFEG